jgi:tRNA (mo5U34)-methyltransferase
MLAHGAKWVVGIDPTLVFVAQWLACRHFAGDLPNYVLPLGIEDLPSGPASFDCVFSMGVLYHRRDPLQHLRRIHELLDPEGTLVLETLVLPPAQRREVLRPRTRYARMRNVWSIPGTDRLAEWLQQSGYRNIRLLDRTPTTSAEQRSTDWMKFESLAQSLHASIPGLTQEGYPAPIRAVLLATA